jgi:hypothetical protein
MNSLGKTYEAMGAMMHDSMRENITCLARTEISYLQRDDDVITVFGEVEMTPNK